MKPHKKLQLAYFGTPEFSAHFLEKLITHSTSSGQADLPVEVKLVVTQADKPIGRKQTLTPSPVKKVAAAHGVDVFDTSQVSILHSQLQGIDLTLVYAYGKIIPSAMLRIPRLGFWNIHPSLLPKYRGPSPTACPLLLGDKKTGVTLMQIDELMDHGPIIDQVGFDIPDNMRRDELEEALTDLGYELFKKNLIKLTPTNSDRLRLISQQHEEATYTRLLKKDDGYIPLTILKKALANEVLAESEIPQLITDYLKRNQLEQLGQPASTQQGELEMRNSAKIIYDYFRGLYPWPGLWTLVPVNGVKKRLKITDTALEKFQISNFKFQIKKVQLEGKREVDFATFNRDYQVF